MRRLRAIERIAPGALSRMIEALDLAPDRAARLRGDASLDVFQTGGLAPRSAVARLRKRLISQQLNERVDHRSGAYAQAKGAAHRALSREIGRRSCDPPAPLAPSKISPH